jgi:hypothetical protein
MDFETAIHAFANANHELPVGSMRSALDHWEEAAPGLLAVVQRFADGTVRSEDAANTVFFILHLPARSAGAISDWRWEAAPAPASPSGSRCRRAVARCCASYAAGLGGRRRLLDIGIDDWAWKRGQR